MTFRMNLYTLKICYYIKNNYKNFGCIDGV